MLQGKDWEYSENAVAMIKTIQHYCCTFRSLPCDMSRPRYSASLCQRHYPFVSHKGRRIPKSYMWQALCFCPLSIQSLSGMLESPGRAAWSCGAPASGWVAQDQPRLLTALSPTLPGNWVLEVEDFCAHAPCYWKSPNPTAFLCKEAQPGFRSIHVFIYITRQS